MKQKLIEVCRSFSYKLNVGNYESRDFFCSQKREVLEKEAVKMSEELAKFCEDEVMKAVYNYKLETIADTKPLPPQILQEKAEELGEQKTFEREQELSALTDEMTAEEKEVSEITENL